MDIMMPRLEQQPSPAPWLVRRNRATDLPHLIRTALEQNPNATVDDVVAQLERWNVQASGIIVGMWFKKWNESSAKVSENGRQQILVKGRSPSQSPQTGEPQWFSKV